MIIDSHCHVHDPVFTDVRGMVGAARAQDVWGTIGVGCDVDTNIATLASAAAAPRSVWACLGFHPEWTQLDDEDLEHVEVQLAQDHARIVGLGEVGLPWYSLEDAPDAAERMTLGRTRLDRLLRLAVRWELAVVLHAPHGAAAGALELLRKHGIERAVFHWHKAPADVTRAIVEAGFLVSVTPEVVYRERDRELVLSTPLESLLVESDGPWRYYGEFAGLASGPWFASRVAEEVAKLKQLPADDVRYQLATNACRVFHLMWA